ncbi:unnamed protein product [Citrullus colocynthis]|uniref:Uncharacterized protein n=1 Tax=Citrullus colocynthis TaxID=252529 RepID=A0ABP0YW32_9ROSI
MGRCRWIHTGRMGWFLVGFMGFNLDDGLLLRRSMETWREVPSFCGSGYRSHTGFVSGSPNPFERRSPSSNNSH